MASAWGNAWGVSWGNSWAAGTAPQPPDVVEDGHSAKYVAAVLAKRKKRRDDEQERRAAALPPIMRPAIVATPAKPEPKTAPIVGLDHLADASAALDAAGQRISSQLRQAMEDDEEAAVLLLLH